ncbi:MAG: DUF4476 domain-containing protein [Flavipsychrobacter sp.]|nr:DUF4476 domain-containing protein [Flavipsychrobacter sp.]
MKKILFVVLVMAGVLPFANAQPGYDMPDNRGALRISTRDNSRISIEVDGRRFSKNASSLTVGDLPKGRHYIKIRVKVFERNDNEQRHWQIVYEGGIRVRKHKLTDAVLDINTGYLDKSIQDLPPMGAQPENNGLQYENNMQSNGNNGNGNNGNRNYQGTNYQGNGDNSQPSGAVAVERMHPHPAPAPKAYAPVPADYVAMTPDAVSKTEQKVKEKITDTDKLKVLESALKKKSFNTDQLAAMMGWLTFEESRLELAKWAFSHTTDKGNFPNLEKSQFTENNNRYELDSYINSQN